MNDKLDQFLRSRGVHAPCAKCRGLGSFLYGSTSTWRGGMGGCAMTWDVCDTCWGSGDAEKTWTDIRQLEAEQDRQVRIRAMRWLSTSIGANHYSMHKAILELAGELDKFVRGRKERAPYFAELCRMFASELRSAVEADKERRLIHRIGYASQPDIQFACDETWSTPKWGTPETPITDVFVSDDDRLYTFDNNRVTCPKCVEGMNDG